MQPGGRSGRVSWLSAGSVRNGQHRRHAFTEAISVGDEVSVYCTLQEEGDMSIVVKIETWVRDRSGTDPEKVTGGVFTCVALDEDGKPRIPIHER
jgi:acyl-CoA hydrolase